MWFFSPLEKRAPPTSEHLREEIPHPDISHHLDDFPDHRVPPYDPPHYHHESHLTPEPEYHSNLKAHHLKREIPHPDIAQHLDEFQDHRVPPYDPPNYLDSRLAELELEPEHRSLEPPKHFPSYHDIKPTYSEPRYVADMPHLPPPPEMIDMQRNSLFPVDVPKIGVDAPYRPPELVFDELHRKQHFKRQVCSFQGSPLMREFSASWHLVFQNKRDLKRC